MIIGITGTLGSGKGSVVDYLVEQKGFKHLSVTSFMRTVAAERGIAPVRQTFHDIANEYRTKGPTKLIEATVEWGADQGISDGYVIEALHTLPEVQFVQSLGGKVIAVDADIRTRYDRILQRGSDKDETTFEEFSAHEEKEMKSDDANRNNLADSIEFADARISNDGTLEELRSAANAALEEMLTDERLG